MLEPTTKPTVDTTGRIVIALCVLSLVGYFFWLSKQPRPQPIKPATTVTETAPAAAPNGEKPVEKPADGTTPSTAPAAPASPTTPEQTFAIDDDGVTFTFSNYGGGIKTVSLPPHRYSNDKPTVLNEFGSAAIGAISRSAGDFETGAYELKSAPGAAPVVFERTTADKVIIRKTWTPVSEGEAKGFLWQLDISLKNTGAERHAGTYYLNAGAANRLDTSQLPVAVAWNADGEASSEQAGWFDGSGLLGMKWRQPAATLSKDFGQLLWGGVYSQYYTTLIANTSDLRNVPPAKLWSQRKTVDFSGHGGGSGEHVIVAAVGLPDVAIEPGAELKHRYEVYVGPRAHSILAKLDKREGADRRFDNVMFYGWWSPISRMMMWLLNLFQGWFAFTASNWGWAVVVLTLLVRGALWPINIKSSRQMKRMSLLGPQMKELQEKYKEDPQRMNAEVMRLYKRYGVNPLRGCLPMFLQIPIFFGLYRMLQSAVEMRGHGFLWVQDLSSADTQWHIGGFAVNPLPLVMAVTMFIQMQMTPKSPDPNMQQQQKIMMLMPFGFLFFCYNFAAALALYWTVSNIIGIAQSYVMKKLPEPELGEGKADTGGGGGGGGSRKPSGGPKGGGGKPGFMELFAQRLEEQQKKVAAAQQKREQTRGGKDSRKS